MFFPVNYLERKNFWQVVVLLPIPASCSPSSCKTQPQRLSKNALRHVSITLFSFSHMQHKVHCSLCFFALVYIEHTVTVMNSIVSCLPWWHQTHDPFGAWQLQLCANCACKHSSGCALDLSWYEEISHHSVEIGAAKVYRLDASELCGVVQEASKRRIDNREASVSCTAERSCCQHCTWTFAEVWDALLYRASLLRGEFRRGCTSAFPNCGDITDTLTDFNIRIRIWKGHLDLGDWLDVFSPTVEEMFEAYHCLSHQCFPLIWLWTTRQGVIWNTVTLRIRFCISELVSKFMGFTFHRYKVQGLATWQWPSILWCGAQRLRL